ncbi:MAG: VCBS repeat-containing protein [Candidatus Schekmanbacteria bacterium]|nr:VCBS repeat-containing protein [Candidatus Schekmanbacteria bacterium]
MSQQLRVTFGRADSWATSVLSVVTLWLLCCWLPVAAVAAEVTFEALVIDSTTAGDCKMVGDIDRDGFADVVIGGTAGTEDLRWYRYPTGEKLAIGAANVELTTDGELGDVDADGDLDVIIPDGASGDNLCWFANPLPSGDLFGGATWTRHPIGAVGGWGKDVEPADFDGDGRLDVATRSNDQAFVFFQDGAATWTRLVFQDVALGYEGMGRGDIDRDGDPDLLLRGTWLENPGGDAARSAAAWSEHDIGAADTDFKVLATDLDGDGRIDVLYSSSENTADVVWWSHGGDPRGAWTGRIIESALNRCHTLQAADLDRDGDRDVVLGQMHTAAAQEIAAYLNDDGLGTTWTRTVFGSGGIHNGVLADLGNDGDHDLFGANWTGNPPVRLWLNTTDARLGLDAWTYIAVSSSHVQTFGLAFGDIDRDRDRDIVSGPYWYANPGGDMTGTWEQRSFPAGLHALATGDVDGDELADVIAQRDSGALELWWLEAADAAVSAWTSVSVGTVESASHALGAQGYRTADLAGDGRAEVLVSSGGGIYMFSAPLAPEAGDWPRTRVTTNASDEGLAIGDIDRDGRPDIAATTGDAKGVEWYRNPGAAGGAWVAHTVGSFPEAVYPDRTEIADLDGDGRLDIVVTEENGGADSAETYWWTAPPDPTSTPWTRSLLVSQGSTNSLDVADLDRDGDADVITAEHRGALRVTIHENAGQATSWIAHEIDAGKESHLGARLDDLDRDGDLDVVSIAWDAPSMLHLWRNDGVEAPVATPPSIVQAHAVGTNTRVTLTFDRALDRTSAETATNYAISSPAQIFAARLGATSDLVELTTTAMEEGRQYELTVNDVRSSTGAAIAPDSRATVTYRAIAVPDGLVAYWPFEQGAGEMAADLSGRGHDGLLRGAVWNVSGRYGTALSLDGVGAHVDAGYWGVQASALTVAAWFRAESFDNADARLVSKAAGPAEQEHDWMLSTTTSGGGMRLRGRLRAAGSTLTVIAASGDLQAGRWIHAAVVYDGSEVRLYKDGELVGSAPKSGALADSPGTKVLVGSNPDGYAAFDGLIDDVRIYDRALGADEIMAVLQGGSIIVSQVALGIAVSIIALLGVAAVARRRGRSPDRPDAALAASSP